MAEPELMRPSEVAELFQVDIRTVSRWADEGRLRAVRTLGGHRRYYRADVMVLWHQAGAKAT
ncbi:BldC family transcriptional regulator [Streptomyces sp. NPDC015131]|uniref:BldC family transcriptional regulator n=1 Tax=Streptomyces sp. NPDC015131 TaxID=3364941 RepID=UPI0036F554A9